MPPGRCVKIINLKQVSDFLGATILIQTMFNSTYTVFILERFCKETERMGDEYRGHEHENVIPDNLHFKSVSIHEWKIKPQK